MHLVIHISKTVVNLSSSACLGKKPQKMRTVGTADENLELADAGFFLS